jgi:hypothetical protein
MKRAIVEYKFATTVYYDDEGNELAQEFYPFETEQVAQAIVSVECCSEEELLKMLPFGTEFNVAVDVDGEIVQHPYKKEPLTRQTYNSIALPAIKQFIRLKYESQGLSLDALFSTIPKEATIDTYYDYLS